MVEYTEHGNLIPGIHELSLAQFEEQFVHSFANSDTREDIIYKFKQWARQLNALVPPRKMWLDGSFLTTKPNPKDLDLVVFYSPDDITEEASERIFELINEVSRFLRCDAYICFTDDSPNSVDRQNYWLKQFGQDRDRNEKGIVQLNEDEVLLIGGGVA